jgi:hypothetical protein
MLRPHLGQDGVALRLLLLFPNDFQKKVDFLVCQLLYVLFCPPVEFAEEVD